MSFIRRARAHLTDFCMCVQKLINDRRLYPLFTNLQSYPLHGYMKQLHWCSVSTGRVVEWTTTNYRTKSGISEHHRNSCKGSGQLRPMTSSTFAVCDRAKLRTVCNYSLQFTVQYNYQFAKPLLLHIWKNLAAWSRSIFFTLRFVYDHLNC